MAGSTPTTWAYLADINKWISTPSTWLYGRWNQPASALEGGVDLGSAGGTPVYALATGPLQGAGYFCHGGPFFNMGPGCANGAPGYGVVTQRVNVPGYGAQDLYYQHIDIDPSLRLCASGNCGNQIVQKGQQIGTIRPGVGMLEMGFNAQWGTVWGTNHPGPWATDPRPLLKALIQDQSPSIAPSGSSASSSTGGGFNPFDPASYFTAIAPTLKQWGEYIAIFLLAIALIIIGFILLAEKQAGQLAGLAAKAAV